MKKFLMLCAALFACGVLHAEGMQFVTWLSSPLGTFSQLETSDPSVETEAKRVNFCTNRGTLGNIYIYKKTPEITNMNLSGGTTLTGDISAYYTPALTISSGGTVKGKSLHAEELKYESSSIARSKVSQVLELTGNAVFKGGHATTMSIPGTATITASGTNVPMHWSNEYKCEGYAADGSCLGDANAYEKSFVLKSTGSKGTGTVGNTNQTCETNFQVNDTCCEWIWQNRSGRMESNEFKRCWQISTRHVYITKDVYAFSTNGNSCAYYPSLKNCTINPTATSGLAGDNSMENCSACRPTSTPLPECVVLSASNPPVSYVTQNGAYWKYSQRSCELQMICQDASHMHFTTPSTPECYERK